MTKLVTIKAWLKQDLPLSYRLHTGSAEDHVPKSLVKKIDEKTFEMPEWLARKKGFVK